MFPLRDSTHLNTSHNGILYKIISAISKKQRIFLLFSANNYLACNLFTALVNLDFFLAAVFLCKIPFETALSHNWYAFDNADFKASASSAFASSNTFLTAV